MASLMSEEQFQCCICLDTFTNPVSIPCGHNFCLDCINNFWDTKEKSECPLCNEAFQRRPDLRVNKGFADITEHFKRSLKVKQRRGEEGDNVTAVVGTVRRSARPRSEAAEVPCDICPVNKPKAVKSCQDCQASYCEAHLTPHQVMAALQRHRLMAPTTFSNCRLCRRHNKPLERFCRDDQIPVCVKCTETDHWDHNTVPMDKEVNKIKTQLRKTETESQQMTQARLKKMEAIKHLMEQRKRSAEKEVERSVQVVSELISSIEQSQAELTEEIWEAQTAAERRTQGLLEELGQEIMEIQSRSTEVNQLDGTEDDLYLLQSFPSLSRPPPSKDWSEVSVPSDIPVGTVRRAVTKLVDICKELEKKLSDEEVNRTNQYAVDVTLDPTTAAAWLVLSPDGKQVSLGYQQKNQVPVPDNPRRFDSCVCVLGKQGFTTGRCYWVVKVGDKTDWDLGVARESINRKGSIRVCPDSGYWAVCRRNGGSLSACKGPSISLHLTVTPQKVGIFLDYEEGLVSFYNADAKSHIYTYSGCVFTEALYPYFNPCLHDNGKNIAPLVICPVEGGIRRGLGRETNAGVRPIPPPIRPRKSSSSSVSAQSFY